MTIAVSHPGKHGDAIYTLPAIRALCQLHGEKADFNTSEYCAPLKTLFEAQTDCIDHFYISPNYKIERMDMGCQPWYVPIDANCYEEVYHLGFRKVPDCTIPVFMANELGIFPYDLYYQLPDNQTWWDSVRPEKYIVIAPRQSEDYSPLFSEIVRQSPIPVIGIGGDGDLRLLESEFPSIPRRQKLWWETGLDYLETAYILRHATAFVGLMSSQLCLANGFPIPRIAPHDGKSWDMRHVLYSEYNHYPVKPTAQEVLDIIEKAANHAV